MAVDMFLRVDTLEGESSDSKHKGEIQIESWEWAAAQTGTSGSGSGLGAGKVQIQDITVVKKVDRTSPMLYKLCCNGQHLKSADLTVRKAGGDALEYLVIHFEDLMITSYDVGEVQEDQIMESVRINFTRAAITYTPQVEGGGGGAKVSGGWDIKANKDFEPS
jgi:type VI secretion system secreted protein Hcp